MAFSLIVEKILKGSLDSIPSPSPLVKIQIMGWKICLRWKCKTLLGVVNKLLKTKTNSTLLLWFLRSTCFRLFFGGNWRHQKYISKLTDLYQSQSGRSVFVDFFLKLLWDARKIMRSYYKISQSVCLSLFVQMINKMNFYFKQAGLPNLASNFFPSNTGDQRKPNCIMYFFSLLIEYIIIESSINIR